MYPISSQNNNRQKRKVQKTNFEQRAIIPTKEFTCCNMHQVTLYLYYHNYLMKNTPRRQKSPKKSCFWHKGQSQGHKVIDLGII